MKTRRASPSNRKASAAAEVKPVIHRAVSDYKTTRTVDANEAQRLAEKLIKKNARLFRRLA